jgi:hypothetical protein
MPATEVVNNVAAARPKWLAQCVLRLAGRRPKPVDNVSPG